MVLDSIFFWLTAGLPAKTSYASSRPNASNAIVSKRSSNTTYSPRPDASPVTKQSAACSRINDRLMAVLSNGSSCQPIHIHGRNRFQDLLKVNCRNMMALIDNHHAILANKRLCTLTGQTGLHESDISPSMQAISFGI